jgi:hypothetical protein
VALNFVATEFGVPPTPGNSNRGTLEQVGKAGVYVENATALVDVTTVDGCGER